MTAMHARAREFDEWVAVLAGAYGSRLQLRARRQGLDPEDARDAVQETFSRFLELPAARALGRSHDEARALLAAMVVNVARNMRRRHHRRRPHAGTELVEVLTDTHPVPEEQVAAKEETTHLQVCLADLGEVPRKIVSLRIIDDVSGAEVAKLMDMTPGHVAVLLHRARKDLTYCMCKGPT